MEAALSRRLWITLAGTVLAAIAGLAAAFLVERIGPRSNAPPPASTGGLIVSASSLPPTALDAARPLRCIVNGQAIGEMTVAQCVQRNGVATEDPDPAVALPAPPGAPAQPVDQPTAQPAGPTDLAQADAGTAQTGVGDCRQYVLPAWRMLGAGMSLPGCVKLLFDGHCARGAAIAYGRWGAQTVRQQAGEIDISGDDRDFRTLVAQAPPDCAIQDF